MKNNHFLACIAVILSLSAAISANPAFSAQTSSELIESGRELLFRNGIYNLSDTLEAKKIFEEAVSIDPGNQEAHVLLSVSRIAAILYFNGDYTSGRPIENTNELFDLLGVSKEGRDFFNWSAAVIKTNGRFVLPKEHPTYTELRDFLVENIIGEIDAAINDLSSVTDAFSAVFYADESGNIKNGDIEVDYGDVMFFKSFLYVMKCGLEIILSYDFEVSDYQEIIDKFEANILDINTDLLDPNSNLLQLMEDGASKIKSAADDLIKAIDAYITGSNFIREETDDQSNDLIVIDSADYERESEFRDGAEKIKKSLIENTTQTIALPDPLQINFHEFFYDPVILRENLPPIEQDPNTNELIVPDICLVPDTTFSGVFPYGIKDCGNTGGQTDQTGAGGGMDLSQDPSKLKVSPGDISGGGLNGEFHLSVNFPEFSQPVDIWILKFGPGNNKGFFGPSMFVKSDWSLFTDDGQTYPKFVENNTEAITGEVMTSYDPCQADIIGPDKDLIRYGIYYLIVESALIRHIEGNANQLIYILTSGIDAELEFAWFDVKCGK